jgi:hypothetical protein
VVVVQDPIGDGEQAVARATDQALEGVLVAAGGTFHEFGLHVGRVLLRSIVRGV